MLVVVSMMRLLLIMASTTMLELIYLNPGGPVDTQNDPVASGADIPRAFGNVGFDGQSAASLIGSGYAFEKAHTITSRFDRKWTMARTQQTSQVRTAIRRQGLHSISAVKWPSNSRLCPPKCPLK